MAASLGIDEIVVTASAPGKLILFGEHSVVYGCPAVAGAVSDLRIHVQVSLKPARDPDEPVLVLVLPALNTGPQPNARPRPSGGLQRPFAEVAGVKEGYHHSVRLKHLRTAVDPFLAKVSPPTTPSASRASQWAATMSGIVCGAGLAAAMVPLPEKSTTASGLAACAITTALLAVAGSLTGQAVSLASTPTLSEAPNNSLPSAPAASDAAALAVSIACGFEPDTGARSTAPSRSVPSLPSRESAQHTGNSATTLTASASTAIAACESGRRTAAGRSGSIGGAEDATTITTGRDPTPDAAVLSSVDSSSTSAGRGHVRPQPRLRRLVSRPTGTFMTDEELGPTPRADAAEYDEEEGGPEKAGARLSDAGLSDAGLSDAGLSDAGVSLPSVIRQAMVPLSFLAGAALCDAALGDTESCRFGGKRWDVRMELVRSTLPVGAGLGSSAALAVAAASALLECRAELVGTCRATSSRRLSGSEFVPLQLVNQWALAAETLFHGTPSGLDNTVASHGGLLRFTKIPLRIEPISAAQDSAETGAGGGLEVIIVNTHVPKSTRELVAAVRRRRDARPDVIEPVFRSMSAVADAAVETLTAPKAENGDMGLSDLVIANHGLLNALGVGHPSLDSVVAAARKANLPAKLTGAGGGGCAFAVIPPGTDEKQVAAFVDRCTRGGGAESDLPRCTCVRTRVGQAGARIEHPTRY